MSIDRVGFSSRRSLLDDFARNDIGDQQRISLDELISRLKVFRNWVVEVDKSRTFSNCHLSIS